MVQSCVAYFCTNRASKNSNVSFHRFPKDLVLRQKWILAIRRGNFTPSETSTLCSDHFKETDYVFKVPNGKSKLKLGVIPSVFNFPSHSLPTVIKKQRRKLNLTKSRKRRDHSTFGQFKPRDLKCPIKAKKMWIAGKKKIQGFYNRIKVLEAQNARLEAKVRTLSNVIDQLKASKKNTKEVTVVENI